MDTLKKIGAFATAENTPIQIEPVTSDKQLDEFIAAAWPVYQNDPKWVAPLIFEQKQRFSSRKNPFFEHARWQAWIARRGDEIVGRISAQIDQLHLNHYQDNTGYFGLIEAEDNTATFASLFAAAENWLRDNGITRVHGPYNLSSNEECGLLVDGFNTPPYIMMGHARPYHSSQIEAAGYRKAKDLLAYTIRPDFDAPKVMLRLAETVGKSVHVRCLRRQHVKQDLEILRDIFNDAWSNNWGFVPFTEAEFADSGELLTKIADDDFMQIAEIDDRPVAFIFAMPNINEVIRDLDGRLLPFGWAKLLWRLKVRYPRSARIPLMGVRKEYQHSRLGPTLAFLVIDAVRKGLIRRGITEVELSWILEDNDGMRNIIETIGGVAYKRYRIYARDL
ncbi:MAG: N-acetyltransferase [Pseudomonadales bacterium]